MKPVWNDELDAPIASDGSAVLVGHIATRAQAERWQSKGYDVAQATNRYAAFLERWESADSEPEADRLADEFYAAEADYLRTLGIGDSDADFYRVLSAPKHYEWA